MNEKNCIKKKNQTLLKTHIDLLEFDAYVL